MLALSFSWPCLAQDAAAPTEQPPGNRSEGPAARPDGWRAANALQREGSAPGSPESAGPSIPAQPIESQPIEGQPLIGGPAMSGWSGGHESSERPVRYAPWGNGHIVIGYPDEDPQLPIFESDEPQSLFGKDRANLFGEQVPDEWDFYNLINTDRPDFTDATYSVGKGVTVWESGYTFRNINDHEGQTHQTRRSLPEVLLRYGITDEFEIRFKWNGYVLSDLHDLSTQVRTQTFGGDDLYMGFKYEALQQKVFIPMITVLGGSTVPSGTNGVSSGTMQPFINVVGGWGIRRWLYLKVSGGIDWQRASSVSTLIGGGSEPVGPTIITTTDNLQLYHGSASLLFQATKRVGGFVEFFNLSTTQGNDNRPANYFDTGLYIYATTNVQFDIRFGKRLSNRVDEVFTGAGFSVRY